MTSDLVTIRIRGVTYLDTRELAARTEMSLATLSRWRRAGAVREHGPIRGKLYGSIADALTIRMGGTSRSGTLTPPNEAARVKAKLAAYQERTQAEATRAGEPWEVTEIEALLRARLNGKHIEEIALQLGRSYASIEYAQTTYLHDELPHEKRDALSIKRLAELGGLLTPEEVDEITANVMAARKEG